MILKYLVRSLALALLLFHSATAQTPGSPPEETRAETEAHQELERKALALLDEVVAEAQLLKHAENRIHVQASAANLFWTRDEKRARSLYKEAMKGLGEVMSSIDSNDVQYYNLVQAPAQLRREILEMLAPRDPELALEFLRATRPPRLQTEPDSRHPPEELQMELSLASQIASRDPAMALKVAEESLAQGFSYALSGVVSQLMTKDREAALKLADAIIRKLQAENLLTNQIATNVASSLLGEMSQLAALNSAPQDGQAVTGNSVPATAALEAYKKLLNLVVTTALSASLEYGPNGGERNVAQALLPVLETMLPQVERFAPGRTPALRRKIADYKRTLDPQSRFWTEHQDLVINGTAEDLLEAAATAPPDVRDSLYSQAVSKAQGAGDNAQARRIIEEYISNPIERRALLANMDQQVFWQTAQDGRMDEAQQMLSRLPDNEERTGMLLQMAAMATSKGDQKSALQWMEEARARVGQRAGNYNQLQAQLQVAHAYATLAPAQSFEILEAQVSQLNELLAAAEVLNGFDYQYFREGELVPQGSTLGNMVTQHISELAFLASINFDRTKSVAGRFQRPETRIMAGLSIAQGALGSIPEADASHGKATEGRSLLNRRNKQVPAVRY